MINNNRFARGLLDWMQDSRPVVDRATLLPIGQYEDGSLTFAWPGFLKDAWEGGQRTLLDAARAPVPDAPIGTKWSSNVDALNAASIAPMAGVGMRAAGMAKDVAPVYGLRREPTLPLIAKNWIDDAREYGVTDATRYAKIAPAAYRIEGGVNPLGQGNYTVMKGPDQIGYAYARDLGDTAQIGQIHVDQAHQRQGIGSALWDHVQSDMGKPLVPDVWLSDAGYALARKKLGDDALAGYQRSEGGNWSKPLGELFSNDSRAALPVLTASGGMPSMMSFGSEPGGLLGGEPQPQMSPLFASAEPFLLERPTEPALGPFEMPGRWDFPFDLDRQKWQDERYRSPIDLPAPEDQFRPTFRPFAGLMR